MPTAVCRSRFRFGLIGAFVMVLGAAGPADAWWEVIEQLSGPRLHGPHIEARVVCFMESYPPLPTTTSASWFNSGSYRSMGVITPCLQRVGAGNRRRMSIDIGMRFLKDRNPRATNGADITFTTLEPTVSWSPFARPDRDFLDVGAGVGVYWFSSSAFRSFSGAFIEPFRADLHVPTIVRAFSKWMVLVPTARAGLLVFPAGFEADAFAAPGQTTPRIPGEAAWYGGIFFDLEALFN